MAREKESLGCVLGFEFTDFIVGAMGRLPVAVGGSFRFFASWVDLCNFAFDCIDLFGGSKGFGRDGGFSSKSKRCWALRFELLFL